MSEILLNKFEKEKKVIELHLEGKTIREMSKEVHMSFRDIGRIIKTYDKKVRLQQTKREENNQPKKLSISSQVFKMLKDGHNITDIAIELQLSAKKTVKFYRQYLTLERIYECYQFYQEFAHEIPSLLSIANFMKRNNVCGINIVNVLRVTVDTAQLYKTNSGLKAEIAKLRQMKNDYQKTALLI